MGQLADIALALDPSLIMEQAGYLPDAWQCALLRKRSKRLMLNCSRRSGKSTVVGAMALDYLRIKPASVVLIFAPTERQAKETLTVVMKIHGQAGLRESHTPDKESMLEVRFGNKSRIIALPGQEKNVRGLPDADFLIIDEASRVPDDLYHAATPMVAVSGGSIALLSTPWGERGFFHQEWTEGQGWDRVSVTADECPRITREFLAEEQRRKPRSQFRQEYYCEFTEAEGSVFSNSDIKAALSDDVQPLFAPPDDMLDSGVKPLFQ